MNHKEYIHYPIKKETPPEYCVPCCPPQGTGTTWQGLATESIRTIGQVAPEAIRTLGATPANPTVWWGTMTASLVAVAAGGVISGIILYLLLKKD